MDILNLYYGRKIFVVLGTLLQDISSRCLGFFAVTITEPGLLGMVVPTTRTIARQKNRCSLLDDLESLGHLGSFRRMVSLVHPD
jgi:hypothetical protein